DEGIETVANRIQTEFQRLDEETKQSISLLMSMIMLNTVQKSIGPIRGCSGVLFTCFFIVLVDSHLPPAWQ
ncbi:hypothetical protein, partial [Streptococcus pneumoniae]